MNFTENSFLINFLRDKIIDSPALKASLCHVSNREYATKLLSENNLDPLLIDIWPTLGKAAIALYSARGVVGATGCITAGNASRGNQSFNRIIFDKLSLIIKVNNFALFGDSILQQEKTTGVFDALVSQFVGCWVQLNGYSRTRSELFECVFERQIITLPSPMDAKTLLQQILQGRKLKLPIYRDISAEGPSHSQLFKVSVEALGDKKVIGSGLSKKEAERDAAKTFLATYFPGAGYPKGLQLRPDFDVRKAANLIQDIPIGTEVLQLAEKIELPLWGRGLFSFAFVHRSYPLSGLVGSFGKDNSILAFLGSNVIQWAILDLIVESLNLSEIMDRGGMAVLAAKLSSEKALAIVGQNLFAAGFSLLHGDGQKNILNIAAVQVEAVQAVIGALFLIREKSINKFDDLFKGVDFLLDPIREAIVELLENRDEAKDLKTRLQECCQAMRLNISYESEIKSNGSVQTTTPMLRLSSPHIPRSLQISLKTTGSLKHLAKKKTEHERNLAATVLGIFYGVLGGSANVAPSTLDALAIAKWIFSHAIREVEFVAKQENSKAIERIATIEIFGVKFLKLGAFLDFERWYLFAIELIGLEAIPEAVLKAIYFGPSDATMQIGHARLMSQLPHIESFIKNLDPLQKNDRINNSPEYQEVVGAATAFRLLSSEIVESTLEDLIGQVRLLYRNCNLKLSEGTSCEIRYIEVQDSMLLLVDVIFKHLKLTLESPEIIFALKGVELELIIDKPEGSVYDLMTDLRRSPLWEMLCIFLPVVEVREKVGSVTIVIKNLITLNSNSNALKAWWLYNTRLPLNIVANNTIASLLHDLKNELLAYSAAADRAIASTLKSSRYKLASDASRHCDEAVEKILVLNSLLNSSISVKNSPFSISMFFRNLMVDFLSWIPERISISLPSDVTNHEILTDQEKLRSVIFNLVRNSVVAMNGEGELSIVYVYDQSTNILEIEIRDNGPGLGKYQLESLSSGKAISSTSRHGTGIGLLTVLLIMNEIHGSVKFSNHCGGGLVVNLSVPSMIEKVVVEDGNYVMNVIRESVVIDEYPLGG